MNKSNTAGKKQAIAGKWIAWNHDQTRVVASAPTRAQAREAAAHAGEPEAVLENVERTRKLLSELYAGGNELVRNLLAQEGQMLRVNAVGQILGISPEEVEERRAGGRLIALLAKGGTFTYPSWQFAAGSTLTGLEDVLAELHRHNREPLAEVRFFLSPSIRLDNDTPLSRLRRGMIKEVRRAARTYGEHGAA